MLLQFMSNWKKKMFSSYGFLFLCIVPSGKTHLENSLTIFSSPRSKPKKRWNKTKQNEDKQVCDAHDLVQSATIFLNEILLGMMLHKISLLLWPTRDMPSSSFSTIIRRLEWIQKELSRLPVLKFLQWAYWPFFYILGSYMKFQVVPRLRASSYTSLSCYEERISKSRRVISTVNELSVSFYLREKSMKWNIRTT